jgi:hypothetical protein
VIDFHFSWEGLEKNWLGSHAKEQVSPDRYEADYTLSAEMLDSMASLAIQGLMSWDGQT